MEIRKKRSEKLTRQEMADFNRWRKKQATKLDAYCTLRISQNTYDRVLITKSGHPDTIEKIRQAIAEQ